MPSTVKGIETFKKIMRIGTFQDNQINQHNSNTSDNSRKKVKNKFMRLEYFGNDYASIYAIIEIWELYAKDHYQLS